MNATRMQHGGSPAADRLLSYVNNPIDRTQRLLDRSGESMPRTQPGQVLIVDDDAGIRGFIGMALRAEGYRITVANNGQEGLERAVEVNPDVILLDLSMPVMNGWELQRQLKEQGYNIPIVFMTAGYSAKAEAEQHGAAGYLAKPFEVEDLIDIVSKFAGIDR